MTKHISLVALAVLATPVLAHPGHDAPGGMGHWLSDLSHGAVVLGLAGLCAVVIGGGLTIRRRRARKG